MVAWCSGNAFHFINEVTLHGLVLRWVTACGQVMTHLGMYQPPRSTQPSIRPG